MNEMIEVFFRVCSECGGKIGVLGEQAIQIDKGEMNVVCVDHENYGHDTVIVNEEEDLPLESET